MDGAYARFHLKKVIVLNLVRFNQYMDGRKLLRKVSGIMFGELIGTEIRINGGKIHRDNVFEKGKIDKRMQTIIEELRNKDDGFGYTSEGSSKIVTFNNKKVAVIRTYSSDSNSVGFSTDTKTLENYAIIAFTFDSENSQITEMYFIPKGTKEIPESGKSSKGHLEYKGWKCDNIDCLCSKLLELQRGTIDEAKL